jgi:hypothetical protein
MMRFLLVTQLPHSVIKLAMRALKAHIKLLCNHVCPISATMAQLYLAIRAGLDGSA